MPDAGRAGRDVGLLRRRTHVGESDGAVRPRDHDPSARGAVPVGATTTPETAMSWPSTAREWYRIFHARAPAGARRSASTG